MGAYQSVRAGGAEGNRTPDLCSAIAASPKKIASFEPLPLFGNVNGKGTEPESRVIYSGMTPESRTSGDELLAEVMAHCREQEISLNEFGRRAGMVNVNLHKLGKIKRVTAETVRRARRAIAGIPFEQRDPVVEMEEMRRRSEAMKAGRQPGESLADMIRRIGREVDEERREQSADYQDVRTPSALLQRAKAEWPKQYARVRAYALEQGIQPCEAWRRVIVAGVKTVG
jgi:hypothetical protein